MRRLSSLAILMLIVFGIQSRAEVEMVTYKGWQGCYRISSGRFSLVVVPDIGGRVMEYSIDETSCFYQVAEELGKTHEVSFEGRRNYGGYKTWVSPKERWEKSWPPDPFLEFGKANVAVLGKNSLRIIGAPSLYIGVFFIKDITVFPDGKVEVIQRMRNITSKELKWGIRDVTKVEVPCHIILPINPKSKFPDGLKFWNGKDKKGEYWKIKDNLCLIKQGGGVCLGTDCADGWMVYIGGGLIYAKVSPGHEVEKEYPEDGCSVVIWDCKSNLEMEVLTPIGKFKSGEEFSSTEYWYIGRLKEEIKTDDDLIKQTLDFLSEKKIGLKIN